MTQTGRAAEAAEAADDGLVLAELAVAGERRELGDQALAVVDGNAAAAGWRATCVFCQGVSAA